MQHLKKYGLIWPIFRMNLFFPHSSLDLKNRSVMAPMTRVGCDENGIPAEELGDYFVRWAQNNVGLIIIEICAVNSKDASLFL